MKKWIKSAVILLLCISMMLLCTGCAKEFDASEYTKAVLDLSFQHDMTKALEVMDGATKSSLNAQYEDFINSFVANNITNEMEINETKSAQFSDLVAKIFATMRYDVGKAEKVGKTAYKVPVKVQTSDIFKRFQQRITEDSLKIAEKVKNGGYQGTQEEVTAQVLADIVNHAYELLEVSYMEAEFGDEVTVNLTVKADEDKEYYIPDQDMENLIIKILQLDEIQG